MLPYLPLCRLLNTRNMAASVAACALQARALRPCTSPPTSRRALGPAPTSAAPRRRLGTRKAPARQGWAAAVPDTGASPDRADAERQEAGKEPESGRSGGKSFDFPGHAL